MGFLDPCFFRDAFCILIVDDGIVQYEDKLLHSLAIGSTEVVILNVLMVREMNQLYLSQ